MYLRPILAEEQNLSLFLPAQCLSFPRRLIALSCTCILRQTWSIPWLFRDLGMAFGSGDLETSSSTACILRLLLGSSRAVLLEKLLSLPNPWLWKEVFWLELLRLTQPRNTSQVLPTRTCSDPCAIVILSLSLVWFILGATLALHPPRSEIQAL